MNTVHLLNLFCQGCIYFVRASFILSRLHLFCQGCIYFVTAACIFCQGCIYFVKAAFFFLIFLGGFFFFLFVQYSALLHLPPLRFHCADGCWDRTQDRLHCQSDALTTRLHLSCQGCIYFCEGAMAGPTGVQGAALPQIWEWRRGDGVPGHAPSCPGQYM